jgi:hypothetical protein
MDGGASLFFLIAVTAVSTVTQIQAVKKQEKLKKKQLAIVGEKRALDFERERDRLKREARKRRAAIIARSQGAGLRGSSIALSGGQAISSKEAGQKDFLEQQNALAARADAITAQQISADAQSQVQQSFISGLTDIVSIDVNDKKGSDIFELFSK